MSITYNITTNFASKDALPDNDPGKVIRGSDFSAEFTGIQTAFLSAAPASNPTFTGTSTFASVDINGGSVDGTIIGASSKAAGSFTTITATGLSVLPSVNIDGGAIDGTTVGASVPSTGAFTTLSASSIAGPLTGNVTGNVTGNLTGDVVGNVIGNISAVTGTSSFNNVTINGSLDMVAGTSATVTNLSTPVNASDAATKAYVDTGIANLIDSAPGALDTLNELAAALGDDANFATTTANSLATKLPLAGGTMTGNITFSSGKVTGLPTPSATSDAAPKSYVDDNFLSLNGGALLGTLDMGSNKVRSTYVPVDDYDLANKLYVEGIAGSASAAAASAAAALTSENNAATSETNASNSASAALASENAAATLYDSFDDRYLGAKASDPALDNDGDALITGALYFNTTSSNMKVYNSSAWVDAYTSITGQTLDQVTTTGNTTTNAITVGNLTSTGIDDNATSTAITIDASENVGIGTASPDGKLNVFSASAGSVSADADADELVLENSGNVGLSLLTASTGESGIYFGNPGTNGQKDFYLKYYHESHATTANRRAFTFNTRSAERMRIDSSGNVGIGVSAPESITHIKDTGNVSTTLQIESAASQYAPVINFDGIVGANSDYLLGEINGSWDTHTNVVSAIRFESGADTTNKDDGLISFWTSSSGPTLTERMRIDSSGDFLVGSGSRTYTVGSGTYELDIAGGLNLSSGRDNGASMTFEVSNSEKMRLDASGNLTATGNVTAYSDERLKDNIETLDGSKVYEMRGVSFTKDGEASSGVIAQELQKVAPELVHEGGEYLSVAYGNLVGYLIEAVKELKAEIDELKGAK